MFTQTNKNTACVILQDDKIPWVNCYIIFIIFSQRVFSHYFPTSTTDTPQWGCRSVNRISSMRYAQLPIPTAKKG